MTDFETKEILVGDPLEDVFDIDPGTTMEEVKIPIDEPAIIPDVYDSKDAEIEKQLQEIYLSAMSQFDAQSTGIRNVEGRYKARNGEVAIQALNTALQAVRAKADIKLGKEKLSSKERGKVPNTVNQNLIVADRNELLKIMAKNK